MVSEYKYKNIELFPEVFADLMIQLFSIKPFKRNDCIDTIVEYHKQNGGKCEKRSYTNSFKSATRLLREKGYDLQNPAHGTWQINKQYDGYDPYRNKFAVETSDDIQREIGTGKETIYVYYYPVYKKYAQLKGQSEWYCKVGMTTRNIWDRIYSQAGTAFPEEPFVALTIKCDDAHMLEQTIHNALKLRNKWLETAPGTEWFITSPEGVENIYNSIVKGV